MGVEYGFPLDPIDPYKKIDTPLGRNPFRRFPAYRIEHCGKKSQATPCLALSLS